jgi:hypothetical protein
MNEAAKIVGVVRGASNATVQALFECVLDRWSQHRVAGVIAEGHGLADRSCNAGFLRSIATSERFPIFQDLGMGSTACHLDPGGVATAAAAIQRDVAAGCDLVVLNKFGKLEAAGGGLLDVFTTAAEAHIPLLTSVSPAFEAALVGFAAPLHCFIPADIVEIEEWIGALRGENERGT